MVRFQIILLLYTAIGVLIHKFHVLNEQGRDSVSSLIVNVFLPFTILNGFLNDVSLEALRASFEVLLAALFGQILCFAIAKLLYRKQEPARRHMLEYATATSNFSFLGMPTAQAAFGNDGYYLTAVSQIIYRIFLWMVLTPPIIRSAHPDQKRKWYLLLKNPCMIALIVGLLTLLLPVKPPEPIMAAVKGLSACSTPLCMIIVGYVLLDIDWKNTPVKLLTGYCALRLAMIPALLFLVFSVLPVAPFTRNIIVLVAAMPAPSTAAIFAQKYKQDANLTSQFVFISTMLSFVTVPLVTAFLHSH